MNPIKFIDLRPYGKIASRLNVAYDRVFNSSQYIGGIEVEKFEKEWAEYCGAKYCVGVGNGHDALTLACRYFSKDYFPVKPTAFTPWKTCLPTWAAVRNGNLSPVIPGGWIVDPIVIAVHIYGQITLPDCSENAITIEDCAQAHGAKLNGTMAGRFGKVAAWSFYPTKNLGALGDGGAITTDSEDITNYVREMHNYGNRDDVGINSRLDPLQAAFLSAKLPFLNDLNERRVENAMTYMEEFGNPTFVDLPFMHGEFDRPCWHIFNIEVNNRDDLRAFLAKNNVETMIHYPHVPYPSGWRIKEGEDWARKNISLPVAPHVTPYDCKQIVNLIKKWKGA